MQTSYIPKGSFLTQFAGTPYANDGLGVETFLMLVGDTVITGPLLFGQSSPGLVRHGVWSRENPRASLRRDTRRQSQAGDDVVGRPLYYVGVQPPEWLGPSMSGFHSAARFGDFNKESVGRFLDANVSRAKDFVARIRIRRILDRKGLMKGQAEEREPLVGFLTHLCFHSRLTMEDITQIASAQLVREPRKKNLHELFKAIIEQPLFRNKTQITESDGTRKIDLDVFEGILVNGVRTDTDILLSDYLDYLIDPEVAGALAAGTQAVPHSFSPLDAGIAGKAKLTQMHVLDREAAGQGKAIIFNSKGEHGTPVTVKVHERGHAVDARVIGSFPGDLHTTWTKVSPTERFEDIYKKILDNAYSDEALCFALELRYARLFREKTGRELTSYGSFGSLKGEYETLEPLVRREGLAGLKKHIRTKTSYINYKMATLVQAVLLKSNKKMPSWADITEGLVVKDNLGRPIISISRLKELSKKYLSEFLAGKEANMALWTLGLNGIQTRRIFKLFRFLKGDLSAEEATLFLKTDFDHIIPMIGDLFFGEKPVQVALPATARAGQAAVQLPVLDKAAFRTPVPLPTALDEQNAVADKVELVGAFARKIRKILTSDEMIVKQTDTLLGYAEKADPITASRVYSELVRVYSQYSNSELTSLCSEDYPVYARRWRIGFSLAASGYVAQARESFFRAVGHLSVNFRPSDNIKLHRLIELGLYDVAEKLWDHMWEQHAGALSAYEEWSASPEQIIADGFKHEAHDQGLLNLSLLCGELFREVSSENFLGMPSRFKSKVLEGTKQLRELFAQGANQKIGVYKAEYAAASTAETIDQLVEENPQWEKSTVPDCARLIGGLYQKKGGGDAFPEFIKACCTNAGLFETAISSLVLYPASVTKVYLCEYVRQNIPKGIPDAHRARLLTRLAHEYKDTLERLEGFMNEDDGEEQTREDGSPKNVPMARDSYFWNNHLSQIAKTLFESGDPVASAEARRILQEELSDSTQCFDDFHWSEGSEGISSGIEKFVPSVHKASQLIDNLFSWPSSEQRAVLVQAKKLLDASESDGDEYDKIKRELSITVVKKAIQVGEIVLARDYQEEIAVQRGSKKDFFAKMQQENFEFRVSNLSSFFKALINQRRSQFDLAVQAVRADVKNQRQLYSVGSILEILEFLMTDEIKARFSYVDEALYTLAKICIDAFVQYVRAGSIFTVFSDYSWNSLSDVLKALPIDAAKKDELYAHLISIGTPRPSTVVAEPHELASLVSGLETFSDIVGNPDCPKAEAILLSRLQEISVYLDLIHGGQEEQGVINSLSWVYGRVASPVIVNPANSASLARLRDTGDYQSARQDVFFLTGQQVPAPPSDASVIGEYRAALAAGDVGALATMAPSLKAVIRKELRGRLASLSDGEYVSAADLGAGFFGEVARDWQRANGTVPGSALAEKLFHIWFDCGDHSETAAKKTFLFALLVNQNFSLETRRLVFDALAEARVISPHQKKLGQEARSHLEKEELFYEMIQPVRLRGHKYSAYRDKERLIHPSDTFVQIGFDQEPRQAREFVNDYRYFRKNSYNVEGEGFGDWEAEVDSKWDWIIFNEYYRKVHDAHDYPLLIGLTNPNRKKKLKEDQIRNAICPQDVLDRVPWFNRRIVRGTSHWQWERAAKSFGDFDNVQRREERVGVVLGAMRLYEKAKDKVNRAKLNLPAAFKGRGPLTEFMLTRYYIELDPGQQHTLSQKMEPAEADKALCVFLKEAKLEKVGQFLSYWSEVPEFIQRELRELQSDVPKSSRREVIDTIRKEITNKKEAEAIIANLEAEPLGSGTIGDCYKSRLSNGKTIVVKVTTPTKKARLQESINRAGKVRYLISLNQKDLPGAREAIRLISLFIGMIYKELNLLNEVQNQERAAKRVPEGMGVPKAYASLNSESVLVQDFVDGKKISEISDAGQRREATQQIRQWLIDNFKKGWFHSDLQPGNVIIDEEGKVWIIDFGQVGKLNIGERRLLGRMIDQIREKDVGALAKTLSEMTEQRIQKGSEDRFTEGLEPVLDGFSGDDKDLSETIRNIFSAWHEAGLRIQLPYMQVLKGMATFEAMVAHVSGD